MTCETLNRVGELTADDNGQLVFRLKAAQCATCNAACQRHGVRELVVPSPASVESAGQSVVLGWSRRELSRAALRVYGPPIAGILLAIGVSMVEQFPDSMASIAVFAGMVGGMLLAKLIEVVWQPVRGPEISLHPFNLQPSNNDE